MSNVTRMRVGPIVEPSQAARDLPPEQVTPVQILNFFAIKPSVDFPNWTIYFFVIGLCSLAGVGKSPGLFAVTLLMGGIGALGIYLSRGPLREYAGRDTVTERAFDNWIDYQSRLSITRACERMGIERSDFEETGPDKVVIRHPTSIVGTLESEVIPAYRRTSNLPGDRDLKFAIAGEFVGTDGKRRWRFNRFIWLVPMQAYLSAYVCDIKMASVTTVDNRTQIATERTDEFEISDQVSQYFYQSVVGIISGQHEIKNVGSSFFFKLSIENAESIEVNIAGDLSAEVKAFRTWINDYKKALLHGGMPGGPPSQNMYPPMGGYPTPGYPTTGYPPAGYPTPGYPPTGYPPAGYPPTGYPPTGAPPTYPPGGYPATGYPPAGAPPTYPPGAYPPPAYSMPGYPPTGYPPAGAPPDAAPGGMYPQGADTIPGMYPATPTPDPASASAPSEVQADGNLAPIHAVTSEGNAPQATDGSPGQPLE